MLRRILQYLPGFFIGVLSSGILFLLILNPRGTPIELDPLPTESPHTIHVAGCVMEPGVYHLPNGAIVQDAIRVAGGPCDEAVMSRINLAGHLTDGERIFLPCED